MSAAAANLRIRKMEHCHRLWQDVITDDLDKNSEISSGVQREVGRKSRDKV